jgi:rRNA maturation protein Nop10
MPAIIAALLPSASCSLKHKVSAPARIEPAEPFRIYRYMLSISINYFVAGSTGH